GFPRADARWLLVSTAAFIIDLARFASRPAWVLAPALVTTVRSRQQPTRSTRRLPMISSRRQFFRVGLGLSAAASLPFVAGCAALPGAAPSGMRVADGVYRARIGSATVTAIADGFAVRPLADGFVRNASLEQVRQA